MEDLPQRKEMRLHGYDYSRNGAYFITICVKDRHAMLWNVGATCGRPQDTSHLSEYGSIIEDEINRIGSIYDNDVIIDKYAIMPNHIHLIVSLQGNDGRQRSPLQYHASSSNLKVLLQNKSGFRYGKSYFMTILSVMNRTIKRYGNISIPTH